LSGKSGFIFNACRVTPSDLQIFPAIQGWVTAAISGLIIANKAIPLFFSLSSNI